MSSAGNQECQPKFEISSTPAPLEALKAKITIVESALTGGKKWGGRRAELRPWDEDDTGSFVREMFPPEHGDIVASMMIMARRVVGTRWHDLGAARFRLLAGWPRLWFAERSDAVGGYTRDAWHRSFRLQGGHATYNDAVQVSGVAADMLALCKQIVACPPEPERLSLPRHEIGTELMSARAHAG
jgi:hypothetical protein